MTKLAFIILMSLLLFVQNGCNADETPETKDRTTTTGKNQSTRTGDKPDAATNETQKKIDEAEQKVEDIKKELNALLENKKLLDDTLKNNLANPAQQPERMRQLSEKIRNRQPIEDDLVKINQEEEKQISAINKKLDDLNLASIKVVGGTTASQEEVSLFSWLLMLSLYFSVVILALILVSVLGAWFGRRAANKAMEKAGIW